LEWVSENPVEVKKVGKFMAPIRALARMESHLKNKLYINIQNNAYAFLNRK